MTNQELHNGEVWAEGDPQEIKGITKQYVLDLIAEIKALQKELVQEQDTACNILAGLTEADFLNWEAAKCGLRIGTAHNMINEIRRLRKQLIDREDRIIDLKNRLDF